MVSEFLSIPPNIKQHFTPFVLDPSQPLNMANIEVKAPDGTSVVKSDDIEKAVKDVNAVPQFFSFKSLKTDRENYGKLTICPSSYMKIPGNLTTDETSFMSLYSSTAGQITSDSLDIQGSILNNMPSIKIREYLQSAKLNQVMSLFSAISSGWRLAQDHANSTSNVTELAEKIWETLKAVITSLPEIIKDSVKGVINQFDSPTEGMLNKTDDLYTTFMLKLPYLLYYRLLNSYTTNIYEVPYTGNYEVTSKGNDGWVAGQQGDLTTTAFSALGTFMSWFGHNLKITTTPSWGGSSSSTGSSYTITFNLINDTVENSIINFIFINTLFHNNKWMQYHIYQHSPDLYDIEIAGIGRIMMCAGDFACKGIGAMKRPSKKFFDLLGTHVNTAVWKDTMVDQLRERDLVRIPDAFEVQLAFTSLLPDNFNTYIYKFAESSKFEDLRGAALYTKSVFEEAFDTMTKLVKAKVDAAAEENTKDIDASQGTPAPTTSEEYLGLNNGATVIT